MCIRDSVHVVVPPVAKLSATRVGAQGHEVPFLIGTGPVGGTPVELHGAPVRPRGYFSSMSIAITEDHKTLAETASDFLRRYDARKAARELLETADETLPLSLIHI